MELNLTFREAHEQDVRSLYDLIVKEEWNSFTKEILIQLINQKSIIVVEINNEIIGYTRFLTDEFITLYICELLIDEKWRRKKVGSKLLNYVHSFYPSTRIECISEEDQFYIKENFRQIGTGFRKSIK